MTLNGYFALKYVFNSAFNGLACSGFKTKLFGNLRRYSCTVTTASSKNIAQGTGSRFTQIFAAGFARVGAK